MVELTGQEAMIAGLIVLAIITVVIAVDAVLVIVWLWNRDAVAAGARPPVFARQWSLADPWVGGQIAVAMLLWLMLLGGVMLAGLGMAAPNQSDSLMVILMAAALVLQNVFLVAVPVAYIVFRYRLRLDAIGFQVVPTARQVKVGVLAGIVIILLGIGVESGVGAVARGLLPGDVWRTIERFSEALSIETMFPDLRTSWWQFAALFVGAAIAAPIGEEFFFRGFLHNCAKRRLGVFWGTLVSASVFAVVHGGPLQVVAILPMGVLLAWVYDRTGSLWVPIIVHALNNGILLIAMRLLPEGAI